MPARNTSIRSTHALLHTLGLRPRDCPYELSDGNGFGVLVPESFVGRMQRGNWYDPLLLQVLPQSEEALPQEGFVDDPVGDQDAMVVPGLIHKYRSRALVMTTTTCALHCRYCFRRNLPVSVARPDYRAIRRFVREHTEIDEIILSGGDPLMLSVRQLGTVMRGLSAIPTVRTVRVHTRVPVAAPHRVTAEVMDLLDRVGWSRTCVVVIHANCARELTGSAATAVSRLASRRVVVLNQAVLLKGVNDTADAQVALSRKLVALGVMPYYLHQLDRARGVGHFEVDERRGRRIMREVRQKLAGYAVPRYAREHPGAPSKTFLA